jgi:hypothetical protein
MVSNTCGHSDDEHNQTKEARSPRIISMEYGREGQPEDLNKQLNGQMTITKRLQIYPMKLLLIINIGI